ncbi:MAG: type II toxin-antitoxin system VapC family toxin [Methanomassiliicoccaceae archaeon]|nr:type II toxin-antitoxin system VapC family toxin [Methanomassiliicoccaceae archaeon]
MTYFLDTNVIVSILRENPNQTVLNKLEAQPKKEFKLPSMVKAELIAGALKSQKNKVNLENVEKITSGFEIVPFDNAASVLYGKLKADMIKKGNIIGPNDLVIAATVLSRGGILVTNNTREFVRVEGLMIEDWLT